MPNIVVYLRNETTVQGHLTCSYRITRDSDWTFVGITIPGLATATLKGTNDSRYYFHALFTDVKMYQEPEMHIKRYMERYFINDIFLQHGDTVIFNDSHRDINRFNVSIRNDTGLVLRDRIAYDIAGDSRERHFFEGNLANGVTAPSFPLNIWDINDKYDFLIQVAEGFIWFRKRNVEITDNIVITFTMDDRI
jgi:hypothetical protein